MFTLTPRIPIPHHHRRRPSTTSYLTFRQLLRRRKTPPLPSPTPRRRFLPHLPRYKRRQRKRSSTPVITSEARIQLLSLLNSPIINKIIIINFPNNISLNKKQQPMDSIRTLPTILFIIRLSFSNNNINSSIIIPNINSINNNKLSLKPHRQPSNET